MKKIVFLIVILAGFSANAQVKKWTLQECVAYAVDNNLTIEQFELDLATVKIEESDAFGDFLPSLNASSSASGQTGLSFDPTTNQAVTTTIFTATGGISSSLTLFDGLRNVHRLNRAKMNAIASQYRLDDLKDDIRLNVANAYLSVLSNKESLRVFMAQYEVTKQDLQRTKELVEAGVVPRGAEKDLQISKGALLPTLGAFFNYNTRYSGQQKQIDFIDQLWINDGISYGAQLSIPIFNGFGVKNNIKRSVISIDRANVQLEQEKLALETTINQAYVDVMNSFDFSQAQARVDDAEAQLIRTKYDYIFRLKVLEFYFGMPISLN